MNYTKPIVDTLGSAKDVVELINNAKQQQVLDNPGPGAGPAYDLDE